MPAAPLCAPPLDAGATHDLYTSFACHPGCSLLWLAALWALPMGLWARARLASLRQQFNFLGGGGSSGGGGTGRGELAQQQEVGMAGLLGHGSINGGGSRARGVLDSAQGSRWSAGSAVVGGGAKQQRQQQQLYARLLLQSRSNSDAAVAVR